MIELWDDDNKPAIWDDNNWPTIWHDDNEPLYITI